MARPSAQEHRLLQQLLERESREADNMPSKKPKDFTVENDSDLKVQIIFDYYKQQREEYIHLMQERSSVTIQILIILGALVAIFLQSNSNPLKIATSCVIALLGFVGLLLFLSINKSATAHVRRARAIRESLGFLERFNLPQETYGKPYIYYGFIYVLIIITGILFALTTVLLT